jgi:hypothetical protein
MNWRQYVTEADSQNSRLENRYTKDTKSQSDKPGEGFLYILDGNSSIFNSAETTPGLTQEEAGAVRLLNLTGVRIIRYGSALQIGIWEDLDGTELRAALRVAGLHVHPVVYLESAEAPIRYKVRHCPDRVPGESFERWLVRALSQARTVDD